MYVRAVSKCTANHWFVLIARVGLGWSEEVDTPYCSRELILDRLDN